MDNQEYIIINKTNIQKRIEQLGNSVVHSSTEESMLDSEIMNLYFILRKSTPLIPEIEKAYIQGVLDFQMKGKEFTNGDEKDYVNNLKFDI